MTDMPDPVEQIAAIIRDYSSKPYTVEASRNAARAILGARAMQDAMAGREVRVKALEWNEPSEITNGCWSARCELGKFSVAFDDGWHAELNDGRDWEWEPEMDPRSYEGPYAAQRACQAYRSALILSALEPAGAQEGGYDPERDLDPCLEARLFVTPESLDAFMEANPLPPEHTPAPDVPGLVATLRRGTGIRESVLYTEADAYAADLTMKEAASRIEALEAEVASLQTRLTFAYGAKVRCNDDAIYGRRRATAAEAERDALRAEVERKDKALREIGEWKATTDSWYRLARRFIEIARAALAPAKAGG